MIIIGGGELTKKIEISNQNLNLFKIRGTKTNNEIYAGKNLNNIQNVEIPKGNNLCIINWSHQFIKNFEHLKYAIEGVENISKFMLDNPKLNYIYISSSSANLSFVDGSSDVVLDSTYPIYLFKFINMHPATDGHVKFSRY